MARLLRTARTRARRASFEVACGSTTLGSASHANTLSPGQSKFAKRLSGPLSRRGTEGTSSEFLTEGDADDMAARFRAQAEAEEASEIVNLVEGLVPRLPVDPVLTLWAASGSADIPVAVVPRCGMRCWHRAHFDDSCTKACRRDQGHVGTCDCRQHMIGHDYPCVMGNLDLQRDWCPPPRAKAKAYGPRARVPKSANPFNR